MAVVFVVQLWFTWLLSVEWLSVLPEAAAAASSLSVLLLDCLLLTVGRLPLLTARACIPLPSPAAHRTLDPTSITCC